VNREYIASCVCVSGFVPSWLCVSVLRSSVCVVSLEIRRPSKSFARVSFRYIPLLNAGSVLSLLCPLYMGCSRESCQSEGCV